MYSQNNQWSISNIIIIIIPCYWQTEIVTIETSPAFLDAQVEATWHGTRGTAADIQLNIVNRKTCYTVI